MYRFHVVFAIFWRNFKKYFTSVLGYLFIFVFVTICAILTFNQQFFADNLVSLDQLSSFFPALLLFFIPAVTMSVWADEKKQGTDAILFTLPASNLEILMGKYKAVVSVYTVALIFSGTTLIALWRLGNGFPGKSTWGGYSGRSPSRRTGFPHRCAGRGKRTGRLRGARLDRIEENAEERCEQQCRGRSEKNGDTFRHDL